MGWVYLLPIQEYLIKYHDIARLPYGSWHKGRSIWARGDNVDWTGSLFQVIIGLRWGTGRHPGMLARARERPNWWPNLRGGGRGQCDAGLLGERDDRRGRSPGQVSLDLHIRSKKIAKKEPKSRQKGQNMKTGRRPVSIGKTQFTQNHFQPGFCCKGWIWPWIKKYRNKKMH